MINAITFDNITENGIDYPLEVLADAKHNAWANKSHQQTSSSYRTNYLGIKAELYVATKALEAGKKVRVHGLLDVIKTVKDGFAWNDTSHADIELVEDDGTITKIEVKSSRNAYKIRQVTKYHINRYIKEGVKFVAWVNFDDVTGDVVSLDWYKPADIKKCPLRPAGSNGKPGHTIIEADGTVNLGNPLV